MIERILAMIFKTIVCLFKGHIIDPNESIVGDTMIDKRNWLCKCRRCGLYIMHDGAISNGSVILTESQALRVKTEFENEFAPMIEKLNN